VTVAALVKARKSYPRKNPRFYKRGYDFAEPLRINDNSRSTKKFWAKFPMENLLAMALVGLEG